MTILTVDEKGEPLDPAPTSEEFRVAVALHNAQYEAPVAQGSQPTLWRNGEGTGTAMVQGDGPVQRWLDDHTSHKFDAEQWRKGMHYGRVGGYGHVTTIQPTPQTDWTCDAKDLTSCPVVGEPVVEVPRWMYEEWVCLADEVETEWITYLIGEMRPAGAVIEAFYFPPQVASGAHVAQPRDEFRPQPRTMGATHSHVRMSAFWSKTDEDHANWPVEIVVNAKGESKCRVRLQLECHRYARIDSKIKLTGSWQRPSTWRTALEQALEDGKRPQPLTPTDPAPSLPASPISEQSLSDGPETADELMDYYKNFGGGM